MRILITNDDGKNSESLRLLNNALKKKYDTVVVVPDRERSASSHSITLTSPIRMRKLEDDFFVMDGTPVDCVNLVLLGAINKDISLVISGINNGPNMSEDVVYSGTVAAAMEACLAGYPAFSVSLDCINGEAELDTAVNFVINLTEKITKNNLPQRTMLNVNIPNIPQDQVKGIRVTRLGSRTYQDKIEKRFDPFGNPYFWIAGKKLVWKEEDGTDYDAVKKGFISITPLNIDMTNYNFLEEIRKWGF